MVVSPEWASLGQGLALPHGPATPMCPATAHVASCSFTLHKPGGGCGSVCEESELHALFFFVECHQWELG